MSCNVCKQLPNLTQQSRCHLALDFTLSENHHVASSWGPACSAASSARCSMRFASCRIAARSAPLACTLSARKVSVRKCLLSLLHHLSVRMWDHVMWFAKALWFSSPDISWQGGLGGAHTSYKHIQTLTNLWLKHVSIYVSILIFNTWFCLKIVYPMTQWFCWSLSLLNGYFIGGIPFRQTHMFQWFSMVRHESELPPRRPLAVTTSEWPGTVWSRWLWLASEHRSSEWWLRSGVVYILVSNYIYIIYIYNIAYRCI